MATAEKMTRKTWMCTINLEKGTLVLIAGGVARHPTVYLLCLIFKTQAISILYLGAFTFQMLSGFNVVFRNCCSVMVCLSEWTALSRGRTSHVVERRTCFVLCPRTQFIYAVASVKCLTNLFVGLNELFQFVVQVLVLAVKNAAVVL